MTGSTLAPIVIAIAVSAGLAAWLVMVYYAASHPDWKRERRAAGQPLPGAAAEAGPAPQARPEHADGLQLPHAA